MHQQLIAGHRLRRHHIGAPDRRALCGRDPGLLEAPLGSHPQGQGRDLGGAGIDVHPVEVVAQDQFRHGLEQGLFRGVVLPQAVTGSL